MKRAAVIVAALIVIGVSTFGWFALRHRFSPIIGVPQAESDGQTGNWLTQSPTSYIDQVDSICRQEAERFVANDSRFFEVVYPSNVAFQKISRSSITSGCYLSIVWEYYDRKIDKSYYQFELVELYSGKTILITKHVRECEIVPGEDCVNFPEYTIDERLPIQSVSAIDFFHLRDTLLDH